MCGLREGYTLKKFNLMDQNQDYRPIFTLTYVISGKPCQIARSLSAIKQNVRFQLGIFSEKSTQSYFEWLTTGYYLHDLIL